MADAITLELMQGCVGETFTVTRADGEPLEAELSLRLIEAEALGQGPSRRRITSGFVLLFEGPETPTLEQGMWRLEADGSYDLFLVPVGPGRDSPRPGYEAVFTT